MLVTTRLKCRQYLLSPCPMWLWALQVIVAASWWLQLLAKYDFLLVFYSELRSRWNCWWVISTVRPILASGTRYCPILPIDIIKNASIPAPIQHTDYVCVTTTIVLCFECAHERKKQWQDESHCRRTAPAIL